VDVVALLSELYGRIPPLAEEAVRDLDAAGLTWQPAPGANTIAWLVWHLARVQDHHIAEIGGADQVWVEGDRSARFGLEPDPANTGYGHTAERMAAVRPEGADALLDYVAAVDRVTRGLLQELTPDELDRVVDRRWDPPVTLGVRLVSIADDCLQHAGQAAYVRGLLERRHGA
jgi:uncharacterized damage-inducible protein DinB